jgi:hypothetical protein
MVTSTGASNYNYLSLVCVKSKWPVPRKVLHSELGEAVRMGCLRDRIECAVCHIIFPAHRRQRPAKLSMRKSMHCVSLVWERLKRECAQRRGGIHALHTNSSCCRTTCMSEEVEGPHSASINKAMNDACCFGCCWMRPPATHTGRLVVSCSSCTLTRTSRGGMQSVCGSRTSSTPALTCKLASRSSAYMHQRAACLLSVVCRCLLASLLGNAG